MLLAYDMHGKACQKIYEDGHARAGDAKWHASLEADASHTWKAGDQNSLIPEQHSNAN
jgi:hypothetical protein